MILFAQELYTDVMGFNVATDWLLYLLATF